jgi:hypothetical protein
MEELLLEASGRSGTRQTGSFLLMAGSTAQLDVAQLKLEGVKPYSFWPREPVMMPTIRNL